MSLLSTVTLLFLIFTDWEEKYPNPYSSCHATVSENQYTLTWHHDIHSTLYR